MRLSVQRALGCSQLQHHSERQSLRMSLYTQARPDPQTSRRWGKQWGDIKQYGWCEPCLNLPWFWLTGEARGSIPGSQGAHFFLQKADLGRTPLFCVAHSQARLMGKHLRITCDRLARIWGAQARTCGRACARRRPVADSNFDLAGSATVRSGGSSVL